MISVQFFKEGTQPNLSPLIGVTKGCKEPNGFWLKAGSWAGASGQEVKEVVTKPEDPGIRPQGLGLSLAQSQELSNLTASHMPGTVLDTVMNTKEMVLPLEEFSVQRETVIEQLVTMQCNGNI